VTGEEIDLSELDCKIFVDGAPDVSELNVWLADLVGGEITDGSVQADGIEMIVAENDEADERAKTEPRRGFLFFDHLVEVYFAASAAHDRRVLEVSRSLEYLWGRGLPAVAACDYEDELPRGAGVAGSAPWPTAG